MAASTHPAVRVLRDYAARYRWHYAAGFLFLWLTNQLTVEIPIQIGAAIDALSAGQPADARLPIVLIAAMGLSVIVVRTLSRVLIFNPARDVEYHLRTDIFDKLLRLRPDFYATRTTGDLVNRASNDLTFARIFVGFGVMQVVNVTLALTLTGWKMAGLSWRLSLLTVLPVALAMVLVRYAVFKVMELHRRRQEQLGELSDHVLGTFQGIATIQGFVAEDRFIERFDQRNQALFVTSMKSSVLGAVAFPSLLLAGAIAIFIVLYVGGPMAIRGELSVGDVAAFATLLGILLPPLRSMGWMLSVVKRGQASLERIFEILDTPVTRPEGDRPASVPTDGPPGFSLRGLSFAYPDDPDTPVLRDLDVEIAPGAIVGVFGRTGAGKSTLLRLLARHFDPPAGAVHVVGADGATADLSEVALDEWLGRLAVAPQRPFLFSDSIRDNIALESDPASQRVDRAVELAALVPDVASFTRGLDTVVGQRGIMLSGGQRQRVALARALYRPGSRVVLLDDVLSAVDHETEQRLVEALSSLGDGAGRPTTFIVSHRVSAIRHADLVLVLEDGAIVDRGTHAELLGRPGVYRETWEAQRPEDDVDARAPEGVS
jgi:ATP-binding cassette subfamily B protein